MKYTREALIASVNKVIDHDEAPEEAITTKDLAECLRAKGKAHSEKSARKLAHDMVQNHGWTVHRIRGSNYYFPPQEPSP